MDSSNCDGSQQTYPDETDDVLTFEHNPKPTKNHANSIIDKAIEWMLLNSRFGSKAVGSSNSDLEVLSTQGTEEGDNNEFKNSGVLVDNARPVSKPIGVAHFVQSENTFYGYQTATDEEIGLGNDIVEIFVSNPEETELEIDNDCVRNTDNSDQFIIEPEDTLVTEDVSSDEVIKVLETRDHSKEDSFEDLHSNCETTFSSNSNCEAFYSPGTCYKYCNKSGTKPNIKLKQLSSECKDIGIKIAEPENGIVLHVDIDNSEHVDSPKKSYYSSVKTFYENEARNLVSDVEKSDLLKGQCNIPVDTVPLEDTSAASCHLEMPVLEKATEIIPVTVCHESPPVLAPEAKVQPILLPEPLVGIVHPFNREENGSSETPKEPLDLTSTSNIGKTVIDNEPFLENNARLRLRPRRISIINNTVARKKDSSPYTTVLVPFNNSENTSKQNSINGLKTNLSERNDARSSNHPLCPEVNVRQGISSGSVFRVVTDKFSKRTSNEDGETYNIKDSSNLEYRLPLITQNYSQKVIENNLLFTKCETSENKSDKTSKTVKNILTRSSSVKQHNEKVKENISSSSSSYDNCVTSVANFGVDIDMNEKKKSLSGKNAGSSNGCSALPSMPLLLSPEREDSQNCYSASSMENVQQNIDKTLEEKSKKSRCGKRPQATKIIPRSFQRLDLSQDVPSLLKKKSSPVFKSSVVDVEKSIKISQKSNNFELDKTKEDVRIEGDPVEKHHECSSLETDTIKESLIFKGNEPNLTTTNKASIPDHNGNNEANKQETNHIYLSNVCEKDKNIPGLFPEGTTHKDNSFEYLDGIIKSTSQMSIPDLEEIMCEDTDTEVVIDSSDIDIPESDELDSTEIESERPYSPILNIFSKDFETRKVIVEKELGSDNEIVVNSKDILDKDLDICYSKDTCFTATESPLDILESEVMVESCVADYFDSNREMLIDEKGDSENSEKTPLADLAFYSSDKINSPVISESEFPLTINSFSKSSEDSMNDYDNSENLYSQIEKIDELLDKELGNSVNFDEIDNDSRSTPVPSCSNHDKIGVKENIQYLKFPQQLSEHGYAAPKGQGFQNETFTKSTPNKNESDRNPDDVPPTAERASTSRCLPVSQIQGSQTLSDNSGRRIDGCSSSMHKVSDLGIVHASVVPGAAGIEECPPVIEAPLSAGAPNRISDVSVVPSAPVSSTQPPKVFINRESSSSPIIDRQVYPPLLLSKSNEVPSVSSVYSSYSQNITLLAGNSGVSQTSEVALLSESAQAFHAEAVHIKPKSSDTTSTSIDAHLVCSQGLNNPIGINDSNTSTNNFNRLLIGRLRDISLIPLGCSVSKKGSVDTLKNSAENKISGRTPLEVSGETQSDLSSEDISKTIVENVKGRQKHNAIKSSMNVGTIFSQERIGETIQKIPAKIRPQSEKTTELEEESWKTNRKDQAKEVTNSQRANKEANKTFNGIKDTANENQSINQTTLRLTHTVVPTEPINVVMLQNTEGMEHIDENISTAKTLPPKKGFLKLNYSSKSATLKESVINENTCFRGMNICKKDEVPEDVGLSNGFEIAQAKSNILSNMDLSRAAPPISILPNMLETKNVVNTGLVSAHEPSEERNMSVTSVKKSGNDLQVRKSNCSLNITPLDSNMNLSKNIPFVKTSKSDTSTNVSKKSQNFTSSPSRLKNSTRIPFLREPKRERFMNSQSVNGLQAISDRVSQIITECEKSGTTIFAATPKNLKNGEKSADEIKKSKNNKPSVENISQYDTTEMSSNKSVIETSITVTSESKANEQPINHLPNSDLEESEYNAASVLLSLSNASKELDTNTANNDSIEVLYIKKEYELPTTDKLKISDPAISFQKFPINPSAATSIKTKRKPTKKLSNILCNLANGAKNDGAKSVNDLKGKTISNLKTDISSLKFDKCGNKRRKTRPRKIQTNFLRTESNKSENDTIESIPQTSKVSLFEDIDKKSENKIALLLENDTTAGNKESVDDPQDKIGCKKISIDKESINSIELEKEKPSLTYIINDVNNLQLMGSNNPEKNSSVPIYKDLKFDLPEIIQKEAKSGLSPSISKMLKTEIISAETKATESNLEDTNGNNKLKSGISEGKIQIELNHLGNYTAVPDESILSTQKTENGKRVLYKKPENTLPPGSFKEKNIGCSKTLSKSTIQYLSPGKKHTISYKPLLSAINSNTDSSKVDRKCDNATPKTKLRNDLPSALSEKSTSFHKSIRILNKQEKTSCPINSHEASVSKGEDATVIKPSTTSNESDRVLGEEEMSSSPINTHKASASKGEEAPVTQLSTTSNEGDRIPDEEERTSCPISINEVSASKAGEAPVTELSTTSNEGDRVLGEEEMSSSPINTHKASASKGEEAPVTRLSTTSNEGDRIPDEEEKTSCPINSHEASVSKGEDATVIKPSTTSNESDTVLGEEEMSSSPINTHKASASKGEEAPVTQLSTTSNEGDRIPDEEERTSCPINSHEASVSKGEDATVIKPSTTSKESDTVLGEEEMSSSPINTHKASASKGEESPVIEPLTIPKEDERILGEKAKASGPISTNEVSASKAGEAPVTELSTASNDRDGIPGEEEKDSCSIITNEISASKGEEAPIIEPSTTTNEGDRILGEEEMASSPFNTQESSVYKGEKAPIIEPSNTTNEGDRILGEEEMASSPFNTQESSVYKGEKAPIIEPSNTTNEGDRILGEEEMASSPFNTQESSVYKGEKAPIIEPTNTTNEGDKILSEEEKASSHLNSHEASASNGEESSVIEPLTISKEDERILGEREKASCPISTSEASASKREEAPFIGPSTTSDDGERILGTEENVSFVFNTHEASTSKGEEAPASTTFNDGKRILCEEEKASCPISNHKVSAPKEEEAPVTKPSTTSNEGERIPCEDEKDTYPISTHEVSVSNGEDAPVTEPSTSPNDGDGIPGEEETASCSISTNEVSASKGEGAPIIEPSTSSNEGDRILGEEETASSAFNTHEASASYGEESPVIEPLTIPKEDERILGEKAKASGPISTSGASASKREEAPFIGPPTTSDDRERIHGAEENSSFAFKTHEASASKGEEAPTSTTFNDGNRILCEEEKASCPISNHEVSAPKEVEAHVTEPSTTCNEGEKIPCEEEEVSFPISTHGVSVFKGEDAAVTEPSTTSNDRDGIPYEEEEVSCPISTHKVSASKGEDAPVTEPSTTSNDRDEIPGEEEKDTNPISTHEVSVSNGEEAPVTEPSTSPNDGDVIPGEKEKDSFPISTHEVSASKGEDAPVTEPSTSPNDGDVIPGEEEKDSFPISTHKVSASKGEDAPVTEPSTSPNDRDVIPGEEEEDSFPISTHKVSASKGEDAPVTEPSTSPNDRDVIPGEEEKESFPISTHKVSASKGEDAPVTEPSTSPNDGDVIPGEEEKDSFPISTHEVSASKVEEAPVTEPTSNDDSDGIPGEEEKDTYPISTHEVSVSNGEEAPVTEPSTSPKYGDGIPGEEEKDSFPISTHELSASKGEEAPVTEPSTTSNDGDVIPGEREKDSFPISTHKVSASKGEEAPVTEPSTTSNEGDRIPGEEEKTSFPISSHEVSASKVEEAPVTEPTSNDDSDGIPGEEEKDSFPISTHEVSASNGEEAPVTEPSTSSNDGDGIPGEEEKDSSPISYHELSASNGEEAPVTEPSTTSNDGDVIPGEKEKVSFPISTHKVSASKREEAPVTEPSTTSNEGDRNPCEEEKTSFPINSHEVSASKVEEAPVTEPSTTSNEGDRIPGEEEKTSFPISSHEVSASKVEEAPVTEPTSNDDSDGIPGEEEKDSFPISTHEVSASNGEEAPVTEPSTSSNDGDGIPGEEEKDSSPISYHELSASNGEEAPVTEPSTTSNDRDVIPGEKEKVSFPISTHKVSASKREEAPVTEPSTTSNEGDRNPCEEEKTSFPINSHEVSASKVEEAPVTSNERDGIPSEEEKDSFPISTHEVSPSKGEEAKATEPSTASNDREEVSCPISANEVSAPMGEEAPVTEPSTSSNDRDGIPGEEEKISCPISANEVSAPKGEEAKVTEPSTASNDGDGIPGEEGGVSCPINANEVSPSKGEEAPISEPSTTSNDRDQLPGEEEEVSCPISANEVSAPMGEEAPVTEPSTTSNECDKTPSEEETVSCLISANEVSAPKGKGAPVTDPSTTSNEVDRILGEEEETSCPINTREASASKGEEAPVTGSSNTSNEVDRILGEEEKASCPISTHEVSTSKAKQVTVTEPSTTSNECDKIPIEEDTIICPISANEVSAPKGKGARVTDPSTTSNEVDRILGEEEETSCPINTREASASKGEEAPVTESSNTSNEVDRILGEEEKASCPISTHEVSTSKAKQVTVTEYSTTSYEGDRILSEEDRATYLINGHKTSDSKTEESVFQPPTPSNDGDGILFEEEKASCPINAHEIFGPKGEGAPVTEPSSASNDRARRLEEEESCPSSSHGVPTSKVDEAPVTEPSTKSNEVGRILGDEEEASCAINTHEASASKGEEGPVTESSTTSNEGDRILGEEDKASIFVNSHKNSDLKYEVTVIQHATTSNEGDRILDEEEKPSFPISVNKMSASKGKQAPVSEPSTTSNEGDGEEDRASLINAPKTSDSKTEETVIQPPTTRYEGSVHEALTSISVSLEEDACLTNTCESLVLSKGEQPPVSKPSTTSDEGVKIVSKGEHIRGPMYCHKTSAWKGGKTAVIVALTPLNEGVKVLDKHKNACCPRNTHKAPSSKGEKAPFLESETVSKESVSVVVGEEERVTGLDNIHGTSDSQAEASVIKPPTTHAEHIEIKLVEVESPTCLGSSPETSVSKGQQAAIIEPSVSSEVKEIIESINAERKIPNVDNNMKSSTDPNFSSSAVSHSGSPNMSNLEGVITPNWKTPDTSSSEKYIPICSPISSDENEGEQKTPMRQGYDEGFAGSSWNPDFLKADKLFRDNTVLETPISEQEKNLSSSGFSLKCCESLVVDHIQPLPNLDQEVYEKNLIVNKSDDLCSIEKNSSSCVRVSVDDYTNNCEYDYNNDCPDDESPDIEDVDYYRKYSPRSYKNKAKYTWTPKLRNPPSKVNSGIEENKNNGYDDIVEPAQENLTPADGSENSLPSRTSETSISPFPLKELRIVLERIDLSCFIENNSISSIPKNKQKQVMSKNNSMKRKRTHTKDSEEIKSKVQILGKDKAGPVSKKANEKGEPIKKRLSRSVAKITNYNKEEPLEKRQNHSVSEETNKEEGLIGRRQSRSVSNEAHKGKLTERTQSRSVSKETSEKGELIEKRQNHSVSKETSEKEEYIEKRRSCSVSEETNEEEELIGRRQSRSVSNEAHRREPIERRQSCSVSKETNEKGEPIEKRQNRSLSKETSEKEGLIEKRQSCSVLEETKEDGLIVRIQSRSVSNEAHKGEPTERTQSHSVSKDTNEKGEPIEKRQNFSVSKETSENEGLIEIRQSCSVSEETNEKEGLIGRRQSRSVSNEAHRQEPIERRQSRSVSKERNEKGEAIEGRQGRSLSKETNEKGEPKNKRKRVVIAEKEKNEKIQPIRESISVAIEKREPIRKRSSTEGRSMPEERVYERPNDSMKSTTSDQIKEEIRNCHPNEIIINQKKNGTSSSSAEVKNYVIPNETQKTSSPLAVSKRDKKEMIKQSKQLKRTNEHTVTNKSCSVVSSSGSANNSCTDLSQKSVIRKANQKTVSVSSDESRMKLKGFRGTVQSVKVTNSFTNNIQTQQEGRSEANPRTSETNMNSSNSVDIGEFSQGNITGNRHLKITKTVRGPVLHNPNQTKPSNLINSQSPDCSKFSLRVSNIGRKSKVRKIMKKYGIRTVFFPPALCNSLNIDRETEVEPGYKIVRSTLKRKKFLNKYQIKPASQQGESDDESDLVYYNKERKRQRQERAQRKRQRLERAQRKKNSIKKSSCKGASFSEGYSSPLPPAPTFNEQVSDCAIPSCSNFNNNSVSFIKTNNNNKPNTESNTTRKRHLQEEDTRVSKRRNIVNSKNLTSGPDDANIGSNSTTEPIPSTSRPLIPETQFIDYLSYKYPDVYRSGKSYTPVTKQTPSLQFRKHHHEEDARVFKRRNIANGKNSAFESLEDNIHSNNSFISNLNATEPIPSTSRQLTPESPCLNYYSYKYPDVYRSGNSNNTIAKQSSALQFRKRRHQEEDARVFKHRKIVNGKNPTSGQFDANIQSKSTSVSNLSAIGPMPSTSRLLTSRTQCLNDCSNKYPDVYRSGSSYSPAPQFDQYFSRWFFKEFRPTDSSTGISRQPTRTFQTSDIDSDENPDDPPYVSPGRITPHLEDSEIYSDRNEIFDNTMPRQLTPTLVINSDENRHLFRSSTIDHRSLDDLLDLRGNEVESDDEGDFQGFDFFPYSCLCIDNPPQNCPNCAYFNKFRIKHKRLIQAIRRSDEGRLGRRRRNFLASKPSFRKNLSVINTSYQNCCSRALDMQLLNEAVPDERVATHENPTRQRVGRSHCTLKSSYQDIPSRQSNEHEEEDINRPSTSGTSTSRPSTSRPRPTHERSHRRLSSKRYTYSRIPISSSSSDDSLTSDHDSDSSWS